MTALLILNHYGRISPDSSDIIKLNIYSIYCIVDFTKYPKTQNTKKSCACRIFSKIVDLASGSTLAVLPGRREREAWVDCQKPSCGQLVVVLFVFVMSIIYHVCFQLNNHRTPYCKKNETSLSLARGRGMASCKLFGMS